METVTFCITVKNDKDVIGNCLNSILEQNYPSQLIDTIIVDRGSSDGTAEIVKNYSKRLKIKVINQASPRGISRNTAVKNSKGKYVALIESYAILDKHWASNATKSFKSEKKIGCVESTPIPYRKHGLVTYLAHFSTNSSDAGLYPKKLYEKFGGCSNMKWAEDVELHHNLEKSKYSITRPENVRIFIGRDTTLGKMLSRHFNRGYASRKVGPVRELPYRKSDSIAVSAAASVLRIIKNIASASGYLYGMIGRNI